MNLSFGENGFDLIELPDGKWAFSIPNSIMVDGTFKTVVKYAMTKYRVDLDNVEQGLDMMFKNNHNSIHFGMYGSPIYTFNFSEQRSA